MFSNNDKMCPVICNPIKAVAQNIGFKISMFINDISRILQSLRFKIIF